MNNQCELFNNGYISCRKAMDFGQAVKVLSCSCVGGRKEKQGPLGNYLDIYFQDEKVGKNTWEEAESEMCACALDMALSKAKLTSKNIDYLIAGDLMNQCTGTGYGLASTNIPFFGVYGACSTFAEGMIIASCIIASGMAKSVAVVASSHFCTAERQFRFPLEYGGFSEATAQTTVTGAGCAILCASNADESGVFVKKAMPGIVIDRGIKDASNMGAAMCSAAADTILRYFENTGEAATSYGLIATGDLGKEGQKMALEIMQKKLYGIEKCYCDCGTMIYDTNSQEVWGGGSGCGCSAVVFGGYIFDSLKNARLESCILTGTGAMMSPQSLLQGKSIPSIGHLISFERR